MGDGGVRCVLPPPPPHIHIVYVVPCHATSHSETLLDTQFRHSTSTSPEVYAQSSCRGDGSPNTIDMEPVAIARIRIDLCTLLLHQRGNQVGKMYAVKTRNLLPRCDQSPQASPYTSCSSVKFNLPAATFGVGAVRSEYGWFKRCIFLGIIFENGCGRCQNTLQAKARVPDIIPGQCADGKRNDLGTTFSLGRAALRPGTGRRACARRDGAQCPATPTSRHTQSLDRRVVSVCMRAQQTYLAV